MIKFKDKAKAHNYIRSVISGEIKHVDYKRTVALAKDYKTAITGIDYELWLRQYKKRENDKEFKDRTDMTIELMSAVISNVTKKVNRLTRIANIKKSVNYTSTESEKELSALKSGFSKLFGSSDSAFESFCHDEFLPKSNIDPNGYWVILYYNDEDEGKKVPYKKFVASEDVMYKAFGIDGELEYIIYRTKVEDTVNDVLLQREYPNKYPFYDYHMIAGETLLTYSLIAIGNKSNEMQGTNNQGLGRYEFNRDWLQGGYEWVDEPRTYTYYVNEYNLSGIEQIEVFPAGYILDEASEKKSYVSLIHPAIPHLKKFLNIGSNLDIVVNNHTFLQKISFVPSCQGVSDDNPCNGGKLIDGTTCPVCKGSGKQKLNTAQDSIEFPFPATADELFDIKKVAGYVDVPMDIADFLYKLQAYYENRIFVCIFNTELIPHAELSTIGDTVTATEVTTKREDINDTLILPATHIENFNSWAYKLLSKYINPKVNSQLLVEYKFPKDLQVVTLNSLLTDLSLANASKAPNFVIAHITNDMARKIYDNPIDKRKLEVMKKYIPFIGMSFDSINIAKQNGGISDEDYITYCNQDNIFTDAELQESQFWLLSDERMDEILKPIIKQYQDKIIAENGKKQQAKGGNQSGGNQSGSPKT